MYMLYLLCMLGMPYICCICCVCCVCCVCVVYTLHVLCMLSMALYAVYFLCTTSSCNPPLGNPQHQHNAPNTRPQTLCGVCCVCAMYVGFASCMCCVSCLCCILGHGWPGADSIGRGGILGSHRMGWGAGLTEVAKQRAGIYPHPSAAARELWGRSQ